MADVKASTGKAKKPRPDVRFAVGANIGSRRFEVGDVAPADVFSAATRQAWLEQGLITEEKD